MPFSDEPISFNNHAVQIKYALNKKRRDQHQPERPEYKVAAEAKNDDIEHQGKYRAEGYSMQ